MTDDDKVAVVKQLSQGFWYARRITIPGALGINWVKDRREASLFTEEEADQIQDGVRHMESDVISCFTIDEDEL